MNRLSRQELCIVSYQAMKCPHCGKEINVGRLIGHLGGQQTSIAKTRAARRNAKLGGWPKGKKRGKRKPGGDKFV